jgi:hypothetical protein
MDTQTKFQMIAAVIQTAAAILFFKTVRDAAAWRGAKTANSQPVRPNGKI